MRVIKIDLLPFHYWLYVVYGERAACHRYICKKTGVSWDENDALGNCYHPLGGAPYIWLPRTPRTPMEYGTLAHEAAHAVFFFIDTWVVERAGFNHDETFCHIVAYIIERALEGKVISSTGHMPRRRRSKPARSSALT